ncbi:Uu.00g016880.m01.CDS01 [Anthostomella pinea]|uniref:Uu.00g016880.m01.CDS01 n=1 Tax=Anthostomella pinea TaxID=933095 RepID=A0AAI8VYS2_9PEZI|nr:Uu.00g016880.m01.CDS01 [Anthostomella pinea]
MDSKAQEYFNHIEPAEEQADHGPSQSEIHTLKALLAGDLPVAEAARDLVSRTARSTDIYMMKNRFSKLQQLLINTAVHLPWTQLCIVDLLLVIRMLDPAEVQRRAVPEIVPFGDILSGLGGWGHRVCDTIGNYECRYLDQQVENSAEGPLGGSESEGNAAQQYAALVEFSARLTATRDPVVGDLAFVRRCASCVVRALDIDTDNRGRRRFGSEADLMASAHLCTLCPRRLLGRCKAGDTIEWFDGEAVSKGGGEVLWEGDVAKLSVERWEHWRERWRVLMEKGGLRDEVGRVVAGALGAMEAAGSPS